MSILVTGGAGYIGSHMVLALCDAGEEVVVIDNLSTGFREVLPDAATLAVGDIADRPLLDELIKKHRVEAIIHFAGSIIVPESITDPLGYYHNNTCKSHALIKAAVDGGVKQFIFSSSAAVYGMPEHSPITEEETLAPISPYGTSKLMTEYMLRDTAVAHDLRYVALRYFNVAGADPKGRAGQSTPKATHLIKIASQAALGQRPHMSIFGDDYDTPDGTCIRDYIHVSDLISAHMLALDHLRNGGGSRAFNCGYGRGYSVKQVVDAVKKVSGVDFSVQMAPRRPGDPADLVAAADKIRRELGWRPELDDLELIVRHALAWENHIGARK